MRKFNNKKLSPVVTESKTERMKINALLRKKRRRRRDAAVSAIVIIAVVCICIFVVYCTDIFTVRAITVERDGERYSESDITDASGISIGDRLFLTRLKEAQQQLVTVLPYIQKAELKR